MGQQNVKTVQFFFFFHYFVRFEVRLANALLIWPFVHSGLLWTGIPLLQCTMIQSEIVCFEFFVNLVNKVGRKCCHFILWCVCVCVCMCTRVTHLFCCYYHIFINSQTLSALICVYRREWVDVTDPETLRTELIRLRREVSRSVPLRVVSLEFLFFTVLFWHPHFPECDKWYFVRLPYGL